MRGVHGTYCMSLGSFYTPQGRITVHLSEVKIEVRDSRTGYLLPARDGPGALPNGQSSWDAAVAAAAAVPPPPVGARPPARPNTQSIDSET